MDTTVDATSEALLLELFHRVEDLEAKLKDQQSKLHQQEIALRVIANLPTESLKSPSDTVPLVESSSKTPQITTPPPRQQFRPAQSLSVTDFAEVAFQHVEQALVVLDSEGTIRFWNRAATTLLGWGEAQVMGCRLPFVPLDQAEELEEYLEDVRHGDQLSPWTFQLLTSQGNRRPIRLAVQRVASNGLLLLMSSAELYRGSSARAEPSPVTQRFVALGRIVAGVSHDLNNLLSVSQGNAELLHEQLQGLPNLSRSLRDLLETTTHAVHLARTLTGIVRPEPGLPETCELVNTLTRLRPLMEAICGNVIRLRWQVPTGAAVVRLSFGDFAQLLLNLVTNARDALLHRPGPMIEIQLKLADETNQRAILKVIDNGEGFETTALQPEPMSLNQAEVTEIGGLGMQIVQQIVNKLQGEVLWESTPGQGTEVTVKLPKQ